MKEVSLLHQGDRGKQSVSQLEQVTGLHFYFLITYYIYALLFQYRAIFYEEQQIKSFLTQV